LRRLFAGTAPRTSRSISLRSRRWLSRTTPAIWWITKTGIISSYATDCAGAEGGVVDRQGRLIVACTNTATINIYNKGNVTGPANVVLNDTSGYFPADTFEDKSGNIYATNLYGLTCGTTTCISSPGDFVWWTTANQAAGSSPSGSYADPNLADDYFADIDANGNITVDGFHCTYQGQYGCYSEVPEVDMIMPMGSTWMAMNDNVTLTFPGGINVLANGQISVLDQGCPGCGNSALYLYKSLPGTPASTLTPPQNLTNSCDPISSGYDKDGSHVLIGDAGCRAGDLGKVSSNNWKSITNIDFEIPTSGAFLMSGKHREHR
jgi:hypothetical protein